LAAIASQQIGGGGITPTYAAASAGGDTFNPDSRTLLHVKNGGGSAITVTLTVQGSGPGGNPAQNRVISVPNGSERMFGPFDPAGFADVNGNCAIAYSAVTTVTVAAFRL
jgi:hypothetical protein